MTQTTRLGQAGIGARAYLAFVAKTEVAIPAVKTCLGQFGICLRARIEFSPKDEAVIYARAPAGRGYSPRRDERQSRPAAKQRNNR